MRNIINKLKARKTVITTVVVILFAAFSFGTVQVARLVSTQIQVNRSRATSTSKEIIVYILPKDTRAKIGNTVPISVKAMAADNDNKIGFANFAIRYDQTHLKLVKTFETNEIPGYTLLKTTSENDANNSGIYEIALGAVNLDQALQRVMNLPPIKFQVLKEGESKVTIFAEKNQFVFLNKEIAVIRIDNEAIIDSSPTTGIQPIVTISPTSSEKIIPSPDKNPTPSIISSSPTVFIPTTTPPVTIIPSLLPTIPPTNVPTNAPTQSSE